MVLPSLQGMENIIEIVKRTEKQFDTGMFFLLLSSYSFFHQCRADCADQETGKPLDVDREFAVLFNIFDEEDSLYNGINKINPSANEDANTKHALNGYIFGNLRPLNVTQGEIVRWYVVAAGSDVHTADWHGNTLVFDNRRTAALTLSPATTAPLTMNAAVPGSWLFYCHVRHLKMKNCKFLTESEQHDRCRWKNMHKMEWLLPTLLSQSNATINQVDQFFPNSFS